jgi:Septum formation
MSRRWAVALTVVSAVLLVAGAAYAFQRDGDDPATAALADNAPAVGSCWQVDETAALDAMPWPAGKATDCAVVHTAEVFLVDRVPRALVADRARAKGEEKALRENLMYAQARRTCTVQASRYLGDNWHGAQVRVLASWIRPARTGYFGCAVVVTQDPAGRRFVSHGGSLRGVLGQPNRLLIACVTDDDGPRYTGCDDPHTGEYVGTYTITPLDAPFDESAVRTTATRGCAETVAKYVGSAARTDLRAAYVGPATAADWLGSDQTFACYAMAVEGRLRGSLRGLADRPLPRA